MATPKKTAARGKKPLPRVGRIRQLPRIKHIWKPS